MSLLARRTPRTLLLSILARGRKTTKGVRETLWSTSGSVGNLSLSKPGETAHTKRLAGAQRGPRVSSRGRSHNLGKERTELTERKDGKDLALAEARSLARELARVYNRLVEASIHLRSLSPQEAHHEVRELLSSTSLEDLLEKDIEEVSWIDLDCLARDGQALEVWERIKEAAGEEEKLGIQTAKIVEGYYAKTWERAVFFALRRGLIDEWQPKGGMELILIDTLASCLYMYRFWLSQHVERATTHAEIQKNDLKQRGKRRPAFSWEEESTARAAEMTDRFHKMAMRNLRALRDLRRYAPTVSIQSAGQVNIAEKQVNVASQNQD